jgi:hypothetical protein
MNWDEGNQAFFELFKRQDEELRRIMERPDGRWCNYGQGFGQNKCSCLNFRPSSDNHTVCVCGHEVGWHKK